MCMVKPEIGDYKKTKEPRSLTRKQMENLMKRIMVRVTEARDGGQDEYARDKDNVFANFERIAEHLKIERKEVLMVYLLKHIDGISSYIKGHESQREDVTGRITDSITYLCLLWGMIESER